MMILFTPHVCSSSHAAIGNDVRHHSINGLIRPFFLARHPRVSDIRPLAGDLRHASGAGGHGEQEAMQFRDGRDQAEAETQPRVAAVGTVEASRDEIAFGRCDAGSIVADAYDPRRPRERASP